MNSVDVRDPHQSYVPFYKKCFGITEYLGSKRNEVVSLLLWELTMAQKDVP